ncbi:MAG TPA: lipoate--protein ligase [Feifaniaceae bacterium]|nr:lipoate--protein ligase [Feifaniaceae bacterium]
MIYLAHESMDAYFWFGLEYELLRKKEPEDDYFLFWRTEPTLMIGNYQIAAAEINEAYAKQKGIHIVRRLTGGGTIFTDPGSWQFSYIMRNRENREIAFEAFVRPVLEGLKAMGVDASMSARNDLLVDGKKFSGNAQHHTGSRVLHHGSILFDTDIDEMVRSLTVDDEKIVTKGIRSVRQRVTNLKEHVSEPMDMLGFRDRLLNSMLSGVKTRTLTREEISAAERTARQKFRSWDWVYGKAPNCQVSRSKRLNGGKVEVCLDVDKGVIENCSIHGDFFFAGDLNDLTDRLKGCPYNEQSVRAALGDALRLQPFYLIEPEELMACIF